METKSLYNNPQSSRDWLERKAFTVVTTTNRTFELEASHDDFASTTLTDCEHLLNHCLEQQQELLFYLRDNAMRSNAWSLVTAYYFGFFSASLFLRMIGSSVYYFEKAYVDSLVAITSASAGNPGGGTYLLESITPVSSTISRLVFKKSKLKVHDAVWQSMHTTFNDAILKHSSITNATEVNFYRSLTRLPQNFDRSAFWPATLRARVNYSPGFAYHLVEGNQIFDLTHSLKKWSDLKEIDFLNYVSGISSAAYPQGASMQDVAAQLISLSQCLFLLCRELHTELRSRRTFDNRWEQRRKHFRQSISLGQDKLLALGM